MGKCCPELRGTPNLVVMIGFNYHYNNQGNHKNEPLKCPDAVGRTPFSELLLMAYKRYNLPVIVRETGHFGVRRNI